MKEPCVYIMTNQRNGTLYKGVTSNLAQPAYQHRESLPPGFTSRYACKLLVWYERYDVRKSPKTGLLRPAAPPRNDGKSAPMKINM